MCNHLLQVTTCFFRYSRGDASLSVADWETGETVEIALDPSQSAQEQTDALYKKARKLRRTTENVEPLLHQAALEMEHLQVKGCLFHFTDMTLHSVICQIRVFCSDFLLQHVCKQEGSAFRSCTRL